MLDLSDIPLDSWKIISSHVNPSDIGKLSLCSKALRVYLSDNELWYDILCDNWIDMLYDYELPGAIKLKLEKVHASGYYYKKAISFLQKEHQFEIFLDQYDLNSQIYNLENGLDLFTYDTHYIPVMYNTLKRLKSGLYDDINQRSVFQLIPKISFIENLLVSQNHTLGYNFLDSISEEELKSTNPEYLENFWFKVSLFDKSFHHLVHHRTSFYKRCHDILYQKFFIEVIYNGTNKVSLQEAESVINFYDASTFNRFVESITHTILKTFFSFHKVTAGEGRDYYSRTYLEDFSIIRVYSGNAFGSNNVIQSILVKLIHDFFASYSIRIGYKEPIGVLLRATNTLLKIGPDFYVHVNRQNQADPNIGIACGTFAEIYRFLSGAINSSRPAHDARYFLQSITLGDMIQLYLNLDKLNINSSGYKLAGSIELKPAFSNHVPDSQVHGKVNFSTYELLKCIMQFIINNKCYNLNLEMISKVDLNAVLYKNISGIISLNGLLKSSVHDNLIKTMNEIEPPINGSCIRHHVTLSDKTSNHSYSAMISDTCSNITMQQFDDDNFKIGSFVYHKKFNYLGIIVGRFKEKNFYYVYSNIGIVILQKNSLANILYSDENGVLFQIFMKTVDVGELGTLYRDAFRII